MVGQAREGTSNNIGVGRTKDDSTVMVQRKSRWDTMRSRAPGPHAHGNALWTLLLVSFPCSPSPVVGVLRMC